MATAAEKKYIKRQNILDSAYKLFVSKSFSSTAIDEVVKMAGVAKGTFYLYFKDKYDLLDQIVANKSAAVIAEALDYIESKEELKDLSPPERIVAVSDYIANFLGDNKDAAALLNKNFSRCFKYIIKDEKKEFHDLLERIKNLIIKDGYDVNKVLVRIYIVTDMVGSLYCDAILGTGPFTAEEVRTEINAAIKKIMGEKGND